MLVFACRPSFGDELNYNELQLNWWIFYYIPMMDQLDDPIVVDG